MNVFKEAAKAETKLRHLADETARRAQRVAQEHNAKLEAILLPLDLRVIEALETQKLITRIDGAFAMLPHGQVIEADAGPGPSELDRFAQTACGGPAAQRLFDAAATAPDLVPRAQ